MGRAGEEKLLVRRREVAKPVLRAVEVGLVGVAVPARAGIGGDGDLGELGLAFLDRRLLVVGIDENVEIGREVLWRSPPAIASPFRAGVASAVLSADAPRHRPAAQQMDDAAGILVAEAAGLAIGA